MASEFEFDVVVIGSGPAGQRAAIQSAKLGKSVALVEKKSTLGGVCLHLGTIPSKTLRAGVLHLTGFREREVYGASYAVKRKISMADLLYRAEHVIRHEVEVARHQMQRNGVEVFSALASFIDPHTLRLTYSDGSGQRDITGQYLVIASGTEATRPANIPFDHQHILSSDDILQIEKLPSNLAVIGGGVIGIEYASMFAALGARVTVIDSAPSLLKFVDAEIVEALAYHLRQLRVIFRLGETVSSLELMDGERGKRVKIGLGSGKHVLSEQVLYSVGRTGATNGLHLKGAGLTADSRGRLKVDEFFRTETPHIYAVGDVIGFPSLASTSMEQGRLAACHAFGVTANSVPALFPYGVYTIPEISMVGPTESELTEQGVPYEVGKAHYREIARGQIVGDSTGLLKLLFHAQNRKLLAVHIIGEGASELVHIGQAVMALGGNIDYFVNTVFNYPTLAECYKTAAFDGINRMEF